MLKNQKFNELINQYIGKYGLDLKGFNVLVPIIEKEPMLPAVIAGLAGAENIYVFDPTVDINTRDDSGVKITGSLSPEILKTLNIIMKTSAMSLNEQKFSYLPSKNFVISLFPTNLDFITPQDTDIKVMKERKIPLVVHNPDDSRFDLYQHLTHIILKRCYKLGIDILKSKILLIGHGNFINTTLGTLKSLGAVVYVCNTGFPFDQTYILKHLQDIDVIISMEYPLQNNQIIGSDGIISICDIVDSSPFVRVLHIGGEIETGSLKLGGIRYYPEEINKKSLNASIYELGERGLTEIIINCLKLAENRLKDCRNIIITLLLAGSLLLPVSADEINDLLVQGIKSYKNSNFLGTIQIMEKLIKEDPENAMAHYYQAISYTQAGDINAANSAYDRVITINPNSRLAKYAKIGKKLLAGEDKETTRKNPAKDLVPASEPYSKNIEEDIKERNLRILIEKVNKNRVIEPSEYGQFEDFTPDNR